MNAFSLRIAALTLGLLSFTLPIAGQVITHSSECHPSGSNSYPVGDTITFRYNPSADVPPTLPEPPIYPYPPCVDLDLKAHEVSGRPPLTFTWSGPDGLHLTGNSISVNTGDLSRGLASFYLRVANAYGDAFGAIHLNILSLVAPPTTPDPDEFNSPDLEVTVTSHAPGAAEWLWDFGDGTSTPWTTYCGFSASGVTHRYAEPGTYSIVAYARNCRDGTTASKPVEVTVGDSDAISLTHFRAQGCGETYCVFSTGEEVTFEIMADAPPERYLWDWDGDRVVDQVTTSPVSHVYEMFGVYTPILTVERGSGTSTLMHDGYLLID